MKHKHGDGGLSLDDALLEAGRVRLRPVLLTAAAAVLALIPMGTGVDFNWGNSTSSPDPRAPDSGVRSPWRSSLD